MAFIFSSFVIFLWLSHKSKIKFHIPFVGRLFFPDFIWFRTLYLSTIYISLPLHIKLHCFVLFVTIMWIDCQYRIRIEMPFNCSSVYICCVFIMRHYNENKLVLFLSSNWIESVSTTYNYFLVVSCTLLGVHTTENEKVVHIFIYLLIRLCAHLFATAVYFLCVNTIIVVALLCVSFSFSMCFFH